MTPCKLLQKCFTEIFPNRFISRSSCPEVFCNKDVLKSFTKFTGNNLCLDLFLKPQAWNFIKKETLKTDVFCEF